MDGAGFRCRSTCPFGKGWSSPDATYIPGSRSSLFFSWFFFPHQTFCASSYHHYISPGSPEYGPPCLLSSRSPSRRLPALRLPVLKAPSPPASPLPHPARSLLRLPRRLPTLSCWISRPNRRLRPGPAAATMPTAKAPPRPAPIPPGPTGPLS